MSVVDQIYSEVAQYLDSQKVDFRYNEEDHVIGVLIGDNPTLVYMNLDEDVRNGEMPSVQFLTPYVATYPEQQTGQAFVAVNLANESFRWVKFILDPEKHALRVTMDALLDANSAAVECVNNMVRVARICERMIAESNGLFTPVKPDSPKNDEPSRQEILAQIAKLQSML